LGLFSIVCLTAIVILVVDIAGDYNRHHQHRMRPGEADLGICLRCNDDVFLCTHLPIISIDTFGQTIPGRPMPFVMRALGYDRFEFQTAPDGETQIRAQVTVMDNRGDWTHACDEPIHTSMAYLRIRGNSSRMFDKPNYRIQLIDDNGLNNRLPMLGMAPSHEWALHGPFLDKTLLRNYMWMNIGAYVMAGQFVPEVRFFELILNGEFEGLYMLMETLRVEPSRIALNRYRYGMDATSFFVRIDSTQVPERRINIFTEYTLRLESRHVMEILYPSVQMQSERVRNYVTGSINSFERLIYSRYMFWYPGRYQHYIDFDSFVNYFIINEFIGNNDVFGNSTYFHKDVRGRLVAGPIWDFNNVLDNFFIPLPYDEFYLTGRGWFDRLMMCPDFTEAVIRRWHQLRRGVLAEDRLNQYMDEVIDWLGSAIDRNFEAWPQSFSLRDDMFIGLRNEQIRMPDAEQRAMGMNMNDVNPSSFEEAVEWKRDFMNRRGRWMDEHIESLRQYSHPSRHALWIVP